MDPFVERHRDKISGLLSYFDRVVITGTLPDIGYAGAMAGYLSYHKIQLFDYPRWAEPLRDELRNHAEQLASEAGIEIEFIRRHKAFRKEDRIKSRARGYILNPLGVSGFQSPPRWVPPAAHLMIAMGALIVRDTSLAKLISGPTTWLTA